MNKCMKLCCTPHRHTYIDEVWMCLCGDLNLGRRCFGCGMTEADALAPDPMIPQRYEYNTTCEVYPEGEPYKGPVLEIKTDFVRSVDVQDTSKLMYQPSLSRRQQRIQQRIEARSVIHKGKNEHT